MNNVLQLVELLVKLRLRAGELPIAMLACEDVEMKNLKPRNLRYGDVLLLLLLLLL
jgi:hypothetical protein